MTYLAVLRSASLGVLDFLKIELFFGAWAIGARPGDALRCTSAGGNPASRRKNVLMDGQ